MKNLNELGFQEYCITPDGRVYSLKSKRFLNLQYNDNGYVCVTLRVDQKTKTVKVHRLVALMYLKSTYFEDAHVNHIDGDKSNNHFSNLEWVNRSQNMQHAYRNGLIKSKLHKLSDEDVHLICSALENGSRVPDVAEMFGVDRDQLYRIINGVAYNYISYEYDLTKVPKQKKLSPETVIKICDLLQSNKSVSEIAALTGVSPSSVKNIKSRKSQTHISSSFNW